MDNSDNNSTLLSPWWAPRSSRQVSGVISSCEYCGIDISSAEDRKKHEADHVVDPAYRRWKCTHCRRTFYSGVSTEQHIHGRHPGQKCRFCERRQARGAAISRRRSYCTHCGRHFEDVLAYLQHDYTVHVSCEFCMLVGKRRERLTFDFHCCGCSIIFTTEADFEHHAVERPDHFYGHPNFKPKRRSHLRLRLQRVDGVVRRDEDQEPDIQIEVTPATPTGEPEEDSQEQLVWTSAPSPLPQSLTLYMCSDCLTMFPGSATLERHKNFVFSTTKSCNTSFCCPLVLLSIGFAAAYWLSRSWQRRHATGGKRAVFASMIVIFFLKTETYDQNHPNIWSESRRRIVRPLTIAQLGDS